VSADRIHPRKVAIVIPFMDQIVYLKRCLGAIAATREAEFDIQVILIDNASSEPLEPRWIERLGLKSLMLRNSRNEAVSKPWNMGLRISVEDLGAEAVCLLNSDVIVGAGWISQCVRALDAGGYCAFPFCYTEETHLPADFDERARLASSGSLRGAFQGLFRRRQHRPGDEYFSDGRFDQSVDLVDMHETDAFCGYCFWLSRECIQRIGYIDDKMSIIYSDTDYRNRLIAAGKRPVCVHTCMIHHFGSRTLRPMMDEARETMSRDRAFFHAKWRDPYERAFRIHCIGTSASD
jgi:O-antigen biosynthesis protein